MLELEKILEETGEMYVDGVCEGEIAICKVIAMQRGAGLNET